MLGYHKLDCQESYTCVENQVVPSNSFLYVNATVYAGVFTLLSLSMYMRSNMHECVTSQVSTLFACMFMPQPSCCMLCVMYTHNMYM